MIVLLPIMPPLGLISLTVFEPKFATQTWVPSADTPVGELPTGKVFSNVPVLALISVTVLSREFVTQTWVPSDDTP